ncbi:MAG: hypothetical protein C0520_12525 [Sphingopyxis sp.]|nr:hypothetical protein [Sphingopyxis sp.]
MAKQALLKLMKVKLPGHWAAVAAPDQGGDDLVGIGRFVFPGGSRGPDGLALLVLDPGFRRGTLNCANAIISIKSGMTKLG